MCNLFSKTIISRLVIIALAGSCIAASCQRVTPTPSAKARTATAQAQNSLTPIRETVVVTATASVTPVPFTATFTATSTPQTPTMTAYPPLRDAGGNVVNTPARIVTNTAVP